MDYGGVVVGTVGPVENNLLSYGHVQGLVFGNFREVRETKHKLLDTMATSRGVISSQEGLPCCAKWPER